MADNVVSFDQNCVVVWINLFNKAKFSILSKKTVRITPQASQISNMKYLEVVRSVAITHIKLNKVT